MLIHLRNKDLGKAPNLSCQQEAKLLKRAYEPARLAMKYHPLYHGKIEVAPKVPVSTFDDFAIWYTPGVADPCKDFQRNPDKVFDHTNK